MPHAFVCMAGEAVCACVSGRYMSKHAVIIIMVITIQHFIYVVCLLTKQRNFYDILNGVPWLNPCTPAIYINSNGNVTF